MVFKKRIIISLILMILLLGIGTTGYWLVSHNLLDSIYMTVITAATVGYGEVIDLSHNPAGRMFTIGFIILSIMTIAVITSMLAASLLELELTGFLRRRKMIKEISKLEGHYIVCGGGETGVHIIQELAKTLQNFVVIDCDQERLEKLAAIVPDLLYIKGDATEDDILLGAGLDRARGIVAALPSDKDNLYITVMAKQYNPNLRLVALGVEDKAINKLKRAGADAVVLPASIGGLRMASEMIRPHAVKFLDTMLRQTSATFRIEEIAIEVNSPVVNKKLSELPLREKFDLLILAIMREGSEEITYNPTANAILSPGSIIVVMGEINNIQKVREFVKA